MYNKLIIEHLKVTDKGRIRSRWCWFGVGTGFIKKCNTIDEKTKSKNYMRLKLYNLFCEILQETCTVINQVWTGLNSFRVTSEIKIWKRLKLKSPRKGPLRGYNLVNLRPSSCSVEIAWNHSGRQKRKPYFQCCGTGTVTFWLVEPEPEP
jgi:hypothetical protein